MTTSEFPDIEGLEAALGWRFNDRELLLQALTHSSHNNESASPTGQDNERLEFLGDSVLNLGIATILMTQYPAYREGKMSKRRSSLVSDRSLAGLARRLNLGDYLILGKGEGMSGGREKDSVLANCLEAIIGAVYLDAGFETALKVIQTIFSPLFAAEEGLPEGDAKTLLQELTHDRFGMAPSYRLIDEYGPDHDKTYLVSISINGHSLAQGLGRSKKTAEMAAAGLALQELASQGEVKQEKD